MHGTVVLRCHILPLGYTLPHTIPLGIQVTVYGWVILYLYNIFCLIFPAAMQVQPKWGERQEGCCQVLSSLSVYLNQVPENGSRHFNTTLTYSVCTVINWKQHSCFLLVALFNQNWAGLAISPAQDKWSLVLLICVQFFWGGQDRQEKPWSFLNAISHCWKAGQTTWQVQSLLLLIASALQKKLVHSHEWIFTGSWASQKISSSSASSVWWFFYSSFSNI